MLADELATHGWKWIEAATELPYGYANGLRKIGSVSQELTEEEQAAREALRNEYDDLEAANADADELPDEVDQRFSEIEAALEGFENRPAIYEPKEVARAGVFLTINRDGELVIDRGYVRPEDEAPFVVDGDGHESGAEGDDPQSGDGSEAVQRTAISIGGQPVDAEEEDDGVIKPLPERLVGQLTAHRTLALQQALAENPHVAMTALLHRMVMERYSYAAPTGCLEISIRHRYLASQGSDLAESISAKAIDERYEAWKTDIPSDEDALWDWIAGLDEASRMALLAHCVSYGVNALYERPNDHSAAGPSQHSLGRRLAGADRLARATGLDMVVDAGWRPTVANYLGIVTKAHILAAVREGAGEQAASLIEHLKKGDMATQAERLLTDTGWLPEPLRTADLKDDANAPVGDGEVEALPEFLSGDDGDAADEGGDHHLVAAE